MEIPKAIVIIMCPATHPRGSPMRFFRLIVPATLLAIFTPTVHAQVAADSAATHGSPSITAELAEYRTVDTAITSKSDRAPALRPNQPAYLGVSLDTDSAGHLVVAAVADDSPAARAGIAPGDAILAIANQPAQAPERMHDYLMARAPGDELKLTILRGDCKVPIATKL